MKQHSLCHLFSYPIKGILPTAIALAAMLFLCKASVATGTPQYINPVVAIVEPGHKLKGRDPVKVRLVYMLTQGNKTVSLTTLQSGKAVTLDCVMHQRGDATFGSKNGQFAVKLDETPENSHFMGMPHGGSDWIFHEAGVYDESLLRNVMAFHAQRQMGQWAPRTLYFEMFVIESKKGVADSLFYATQLQAVINNPQLYYMGVHVNMEKIMAHKHRIDIPKFEYKDSLLGGLVVQMNQEAPGEYDNFPSLVLTQQARLYEPKKGKINSADSLAIMNWYVNTANNSGWGNNMQNQYLAYAIPCANGKAPCYPCPNDNIDSVQQPLWQSIRSQTDYQSFAVYFILAELARDPDGYHKSTFMYKTPDAPGKPGKMHAGPLWDKNKSFGNTVLSEFSTPCGCSQSVTDTSYYADTTGWSYCMSGLSQAPVWWEVLMLDTAFCNTVKSTWKQYRSPGGILADSVLVNFVNSQAAYLTTTGARQRHYDKWKGYRFSFDQNRTQLTIYLEKRLWWMDNHLDQLLSKTSGRRY